MATKRYPYIDPLYALRYSFNWEERRIEYLRATNGLCSFPKCLCEAREVHHAHYRKVGIEKAGIDVFPLCIKHHKWAHLKGNWIFDFDDPVFGNHNVDRVVSKLREGFEEKLLIAFVTT